MGDEPRQIGELIITNSDDARGRPTKVAPLQRESSEVLMELLDVQVDAFRGSRMVQKGIELKDTSQGCAEQVQAWLFVRAGARLPQTSRERFFKESGGDQH